MPSVPPTRRGDAVRRPPARPAPTRRDVLRSGAALAALPGVLAPGAFALGARQDSADAPPRHPNVLFVLADSHRAISTGCYGDPQAITPHLDAFAGEGMRFSSAVANTPLCRPYRASLMTGTWGHRNGMLTNVSDINFGVEGRRQWTPGELPTLGETFRAAGYRCGYVGKWHLGSAFTQPGDPLRFGFHDGWAAAIHPVHDYYRWNYVDQQGETISGQGAFRPAMEAGLALDFIDADDERPFFCVLSWGPPHDPFAPPEEYLHYDDMTLPPNIPRGGDAERIAREELPLYYGLVEALDHEFGALLQALEARGLADDTIVVYASDHGNMMGAFNYLGKEMPYHESTGVPFLLRWPGHVEPGSVMRSPFGAPDVFPTLLGLAGVERPAGIDGFDLSARILGRNAAPDQQAAYLAAWDVRAISAEGWRGVRTERYLYARRADKPWMLFDLVDDPWQLNDLRKDQIPLRKELDGLTLELMEKLGDRWS